jgi:predicted RNA binding protein YcfA (HicA-like mRNA interferase family)
MKLNEVLKLIENDGWYLARTKGHYIYKHSKKKGLVVVPKHKGKEIPDGTLKSILKQAGLK